MLMKKKEKNKIMYEVILNNSKYLELVNKIENMRFITDGKWDWEHGLGHYKRVANYVKTILIQLNENQRTIELGLVAALLHDNAGQYSGGSVYFKPFNWNALSSSSYQHHYGSWK